MSEDAWVYPSQTSYCGAKMQGKEAREENENAHIRNENHPSFYAIP